MVEQRPFKPKVVGSIPTAPTIFFNNLRFVFRNHCCILVQIVRELSVFS